MYKEIKTLIETNNLILFIGSGVPATLGLPTWRSLIEKMANDLDYDPQLFMQYGDFLSLAEYYKITKGHIGELRDWMSREWSPTTDKIKNSNIYKYIIELNCSLIYTTNYDHTLESAFDIANKNAKRIVDVSDLIDIPLGTTQIVKFHGDVIKDDSIVISEDDYFKRLDFGSPLDIKLRSDMLGKSILFLGYSLSDINIRLLIYKLDQLWKSTNNSLLRPPSYIFLTSPNPIQEKIFQKRGITPIVGTKLEASASLEHFLYCLLN